MNITWSVKNNYIVCVILIFMSIQVWTDAFSLLRTQGLLKDITEKSNIWGQTDRKDGYIIKNLGIIIKSLILNLHILSSWTSAVLNQHQNLVRNSLLQHRRIKRVCQCEAGRWMCSSMRSLKNKLWKDKNRKPRMGAVIVRYVATITRIKVMYEAGTVQSPPILLLPLHPQSHWRICCKVAHSAFLMQLVYYFHFWKM